MNMDQKPKKLLVRVREKIRLKKLFQQKAAYEDFGTFLNLYDKDDEYSHYARERFEFLKEQFLTDP